MAISFNNIPKTIRTPGVYAEIDNSRALQGLVAILHKALIIGQKISAGSKPTDVVQQMTRDGLADDYFGPGSILARMVNKFKAVNPNTELHAIAIDDSGGAVAASNAIHISTGLSATTDATYFLMIDGTAVDVLVNSGYSTTDFLSAIKDTVNTSTYSQLPVTASLAGSVIAGYSTINFIANNKGAIGNQLDIRANYYVGESNPPGFSLITYSAFAGGTSNPDLDDVWSVIEDERYHYIIEPYTDAANLATLADEMADRFKPLKDLQGHAFTAYRGAAASCTTFGNSLNDPHLTAPGYYDSPNSPEIWAATWGAIAAEKLNNDPARPLQFLELPGILAPPVDSRFTRAERDVLLYDGIATWIVDQGGNVLIERSITTYQANALGLPDPSYLDIQTLATLGEIRDQYRIRMSNRFIVPRFKLADDSFPVQPGSFIARPKDVQAETIALFTQLRDVGLIENLDDFVENLRTERDISDVNRVNQLLPPDLVNQFRVLAGLIQFIL